MSATLQVRQAIEVPKLNDDGKPVVSNTTGEPLMEPGEAWHDIGPITRVDGHRCKVIVTNQAARRLMPDIQLEDELKGSFTIQAPSVESSPDLRLDGEMAAPPSEGARTVPQAPTGMTVTDDTGVRVAFGEIRAE